MGVNATSISASLSRLKKVMLIAQFAETDEQGRPWGKYYMINPYVFSVGRKQRWGLLLQKFLSAFDQDLTSDYVLSETSDLQDDDEL